MSSARYGSGTKAPHDVFFDAGRTVLRFAAGLAIVLLPVACA